MLQIRESFVNLTRGHRLGDTDWYEPYTQERKRLFRDMQREYGRCASRMYIDKVDGSVEPCGWVFVKRVEYNDARRSETREQRTYLQETWVHIRTIDEEAC